MVNFADGSSPVNHLLAMGNAPGNAGEVQIFAAGRFFIADSQAVTVHADGLAAVLPDGHRLWVTGGGALVIDADPAPAPEAPAEAAPVAESGP
jgi:hypothetical protein